MRIFKRTVLPALLAALLSVSTAYAGVNSYPEIVQYFNDGNYEKINEFIYDDQTGKIDYTAQCDINVHDTAPLWEASNLMLGNCTGVVFQFDDVFFKGSNGTELSEEYKEFAPKMAKYPIMRLGFGNNANMLKMIGPVEQRTAGECVLSDADRETYTAVEGRSLAPERMAKTGPLEMIAGAEAMNPDIAFTLILSYQFATPEDNVNLLRFLMDDPKDSVWGALRAEYGHPKPVNVHSLELGNEVYIRRDYGEEENNRQVELYVRKFKEHADAISEYNPNIGLSICLMCMDGDAHRVWNEPIIEQLGPYIMEKYDENNRWVSLHHYYSGYEMAYTQNRIQVTIDSLNKILGENHHVRGLFSEHGKWASDYVAPTTLESGLATCQFLNRMFQWDYLTSYAAHFFNWHSSNLWNTFRRGPDGALVTSGPDAMYHVYIDNMGDRVFRSDVQTLDDSEIGDINSTRQLYSVCAMGKGDKELKLIMANRAPNTDIELKFNFDSGNSYTLIGEDILTAPNEFSFPYSAETQDVITRTTNTKNEPNFTSYKMPNKSMIVLTLKSNKNIAQLDGKGSTSNDGDVVFDGVSHFGDIENHWAENEINLLAEAGAVSGKQANAFCPDDTITRAEFAAMLQKSLGLDTSNPNMSADVPADSWYAPAVNAAVANGYMRGYGDGTFHPLDNISLSEAAASVSRALCDKTSDYDVTDPDKILSKISFTQNLSDWEKNCFAVLVNSHVFSKFYEEKTVEKDRKITRAEAAVLVQRLKNLKGI